MQGTSFVLVHPRSDHPPQKIGSNQGCLPKSAKSISSQSLKFSLGNLTRALACLASWMAWPYTGTQRHRAAVARVWIVFEVNMGLAIKWFDKAMTEQCRNCAKYTGTISYKLYEFAKYWHWIGGQLKETNICLTLPHYKF